jgi:hypothetical protein
VGEQCFYERVFKKSILTSELSEARTYNNFKLGSRYNFVFHKLAFVKHKITQTDAILN